MFSQLTRATRIGLVMAAGAVLAACSSGPNDPGVASLGSTTTATTAPAANGSKGNSDQAAKQALQFSACMRSHGVKDFPDPQISGNGVNIRVGGTSKDLNPNNPTFKTALKACQKYQPVPTAANGKGADPTKVAAWAACMRSHGLPHFPDPAIDNGALKLNLTGTGIDPRSSAFQNAMKACRSKDPGGPVEVNDGNGGGNLSGGGS
ncbi:MAG TPA: hypothetical protein VGM75_17925 [Pseudonocardiaceae bacterium]|jgi:hypothetical protein